MKGFGFAWEATYPKHFGGCAPLDPESIVTVNQSLFVAKVWRLVVAGGGQWSYVG